MRIEGNKLEFFAEKLERAKESQATAEANFKKWLSQYEGDLSIDESEVDAKMGYNVTYELIETTKSPAIPQPSVTPAVRSAKTIRCARSIEQLCKRILNELDFERMNDMDELVTYVFGGDPWAVEWDESVKGPDISGGIRVRPIGPRKFYPQPDITDADAMDYAFISFNATREALEREYGVSHSEAEDASHAADEGITNTEEVVTVNVCYYKGKDGEICKYTWSGDLELEDIEDYYARKVKTCTACGHDEGICRCEHPKWETVELEYEELTEDVTTSDGTVIPAMVPKIKKGKPVMEKKWVPMTDEAGLTVTDEDGMPRLTETEVPKMVPNRIKWYKPKKMPIVIRLNVAKPDSVFGQSDCEFLRPIQQEINKVLSRLHDKIMKSSVTPVLPPDVTENDEEMEGEMEVVDNTIFDKAVKLAPGQTKDQFGVIDTQVAIGQDMAYFETLYIKAKRLMGITESYQGNADSSAQSGKAKQIQVSQSAGRLQTKRVNKQLFYSELFRIIFELNLAYADEARPVPYVDEFGEVQNLQFNRYDFLQYDERTGEYYYDDRYLFSVDTSATSEEDKESMWQLVMNMYQAGMYGPVGSAEALIRVWMALEKYGLPFARENVNYFKVEAERVATGHAPTGAETPAGGAQATSAVQTNV